MSEREMHGVRANEAAPSPPPPLPPEYPDLYGKRRELAKIQVLEREIGFLEEEVKSVEGHQPASRACKEVVDFVTCNADPVIPISRAKKIRRSRCFWKWLWYSSLNSIFDLRAIWRIRPKAMSSLVLRGHKKTFYDLRT